MSANVHEFLRTGAFSGKYFEDLSQIDKDEVRTSYWRHLGAVLYHSDFGGPGARIQLYEPTKIEWRLLNERDLRAVWCEVFSTEPHAVPSWLTVRDFAYGRGMTDDTNK